MDRGARLLAFYPPTPHADCNEPIDQQPDHARLRAVDGALLDTQSTDRCANAEQFIVERIPDRVAERGHKNRPRQLAQQRPHKADHDRVRHQNRENRQRDRVNRAEKACRDMPPRRSTETPAPA